MTVDNREVALAIILETIRSILLKQHNSQGKRSADGHGAGTDGKSVLVEDGAETLREVAAYDHFKVIRLAGKGARRGRNVHGDCRRGAVIVETVGGCLAAGGARGRIYARAPGVSVDSKITLDPAVRRGQGRRIRCRLGLTPPVQQAPAIHADGHYANNHRQRDQQPGGHRPTSDASRLDKRTNQHTVALLALDAGVRSITHG